MKKVLEIIIVAILFVVIIVYFAFICGHTRRKDSQPPKHSFCNFFYDEKDEEKNEKNKNSEIKTEKEISDFGSKEEKRNL